MKPMFILCIFSLMCGCGDKFMAAKIAVQSGRAATSMAQIGIDAASKAKQEECTQKCVNQPSDCYSKCYEKMTKTLKVWEGSKSTANASWDFAEAAIKVAESKKEGQTVDWVPLLKKGACLIVNALEFIPEKYRKDVQFYLNMMKSFGCDK